MDFNIGQDLNQIIKSLKPDKIDESNEFNFIWTTELINEYLNDLSKSQVKENIPSPFFKNKVGFRKPFIKFKYTSEEIELLKKCSKDVIFFAENFCKTMTDEKISTVKLYDFQKRILKDLQEHRKCIWLASRQSTKTSTSAFFITHFICFNIDKNVLIVANKAETMKEILDKICIMYEHLPYWLKPGIMVHNKTRLEFDNGCRIIGQATTPNPGLGFNIHLLYIDEFAHIPNNIIYPFYRAVYPTLSASKIARVIITSTPNDINLFYHLYTGAVKKENEYYPIRVDWYEVPGRDEEWKKREIANLGSEEAFNREYGNQFLDSSRLLLEINTQKDLLDNKTNFIHQSYDFYDDIRNFYPNIDKDFIWLPNPDDKEYDFNTDHFVLSIDLASGIEQDYTVLNIFKVEKMNYKEIQNLKVFKSEYDFLKLKQIGLFRSNTISILNFAQLLEIFIYNFLREDSFLIILEMNFNGYAIIQKLIMNMKFDDSQFFKTKIQEKSKTVKTKIGLHLNHQKKSLLIHNLNFFLKNKKIEVLEENSINEILNIGYDIKAKKYTSQLGNDDIFMTILNSTIIFYEIDLWYDWIDNYCASIIDSFGANEKNLILEKMNKLDNKTDIFNNTFETTSLIDYNLID